MPVISTARRSIGTLLVLGAAMLSPAPAAAGTFTVSGTCGLWRPYQNDNAHIAVYPACPELVTRNIGGPFTTPVSAEGGWIFDAPSGTSIAGFALQASLLALSGWQTAVIPTSGFAVENCPGTSCPGASKNLAIQTWYPGYNSGAIVLRLRCGSNGGCPTNSLYTYLGLTAASVMLTDDVPPGIAITGGQLIAPGWQRATPAVSYDAGDNVGIKAVRTFLDGRPRAEDLRACDYASKTPCPNGGGALAVDTTGMPDGPHQLAVQAVDAADNLSQDSLTIYTDNTPPASPGSAALDGGDAWRATNHFSVRWTNPPQSASPIVAADYRLCPTSDSDHNSTRCVSGTASRSDITTLPDLRVPGDGAWTLVLALRDAAGNVSQASAATLPGLRYDATAPRAALAPMSADDPTRVRVTADDATSGIAAEAVEIQRDGTNTWTELPVTPDTDGFSARIDDGELPPGTYHVRAHVVDAAGNDASTETLPDGALAALALPIRIKTRLAVGRVKRVLAHPSRHGRKRYRRILVARPRARFGRTVTLHGRLTTPGANPVVDSPVEVWEEVELPGAPWTRIAEVRTSRTGRFMFKALRGPSRLLRFRYGGTATIRSRVSVIDLRVKATSSMRVSRHHVVNGDAVSFHGRLKGLPLPEGGKLVELQVYSRREWRTFAQARANATTGLWGYRYRFEAITRLARFRFRARIRKEATYPFELGTSRQVRVTVRGE
jgi:hypothetical protein